MYPDGALVAGVDSSSQATKVVVIDPRDGRLVAITRAPHAMQRSGSSSESDPASWWQALCEALAACGVADRIASISIAAQQLSLVTVDQYGQPVRPAILWNDTRSTREVELLEDATGGPQSWLETVGYRLRPGLSIASWAWLRRHEPESAARTVAVRLPHDWLTEQLTGRGVTDRGDASAAGWWSARAGSYVEEILQLDDVQLDESQLPEVLDTDAVAGEVLPAAAEATGLRPGTVVGCGTGDNMAAALALAIEPGEPVFSLGTSGTVYVRASEPGSDPTGNVTWQASASGDMLPLGCALNATLATDRIAELFGIGRDAVADSTRAVVMPYFGGERLPNYPRASGTITGLDHEVSPEEILLAAYEGVVASLVSGMNVLAAQSAGIAEEAPLLLVGGGARSKVWQQTVRRLTGRAVQVPQQEELVAWGAAAQAAAAVSERSSVEIAAGWEVAAGRRLEPLPRDDASLERIADVRAAADALNRSSGR